MTLHEYLKANKISREAFGAALGVHKISVTRYARGSRVPERTIMAKIAELTGGAVQPNDFYDAAHTDAEAA